MLEQIVGEFPQTGLSLAFGYGSGVIKQAGVQCQDNNLIDIIFVVNNSTNWHQENLKRNHRHYSSLRYASAQQITQIQRRNACVYFNPYATVKDVIIKYGVIEEEDLVRDLSEWDCLYIAGRLHKPVQFVQGICDKNERLRACLRFNRESAIRAATLQLPETFGSTQLYQTITGLSYHGDLRMLFGENVNKIDNIVSKQTDLFDEIYLPILKTSHHFKDIVKWDGSRRVFVQDVSPKVIAKNLKLLPGRVRNKIFENYRQEARTIECDIALESLSKNMNCDKIVAGAIAAIVRNSTTAQTIKGIFTAGVFKSIRYSRQKLTKSILSRLT